MTLRRAESCIIIDLKTRKSFATVEQFLYVTYNLVYPVDKLKSAFPSVPFYNELKCVGCQGHQRCCFARSTEEDRAFPGNSLLLHGGLSVDL